METGCAPGIVCHPGTVKISITSAGPPSALLTMKRAAPASMPEFERVFHSLLLEYEQPLGGKEHSNFHSKLY
jgi:hypothetical protein